MFSGGYGVVFKVRSLSHKYFALKRLCVNSEEDLTRSKQEMALLVRNCDLNLNETLFKALWFLYNLWTFHAGFQRAFLSSSLRLLWIFIEKSKIDNVWIFKLNMFPKLLPWSSFRASQIFGSPSISIEFFFRDNFIIKTLFG